MLSFLKKWGSCALPPPSISATEEVHLVWEALTLGTNFERLFLLILTQLANFTQVILKATIISRYKFYGLQHLAGIKFS